jgi:AcrR family transcriptional regulator
MTPPSPTRRLPVQARSRKRYDAILDAAAAIFAEIGVEAATMEAIAERAETSIGSVYQFFPNKLTLFEAVAERCLERSKLAFDGLLARVSDEMPWGTLIDGAVDAFAALNDGDPAFRATMVNLSLYGLYEERDSALQSYFVRRIAELIASREPSIARRRATLIAVTVVQLVNAMLMIAERSPAALRKALREEAKVVVRRYVEPEVGLSAPAARRPLRKRRNGAP